MRGISIEKTAHLQRICGGKTPTEMSFRCQISTYHLRESTFSKKLTAAMFAAKHSMALDYSPSAIGEFS
jgi:hypothetical protein